MSENPPEVHDVYYLLRDEKMRGLTVKEAAKELGGISTRTIFRMIKDGRLKAGKAKLFPGKGYFWLIDPVSLARMQVKKEMEQEAKKSKTVKEEQTND